jgi:hypothetical protein
VCSSDLEMIFEIGDVHLRPGATTTLGGLNAG